MKICDRTWQRDKKIAPATREVTIDSQVFHLCDEETAAVVDFIANPPATKITDRAFKSIKGTLGIRDRAGHPEGP